MSLVNSGGADPNAEGFKMNPSGDDYSAVVAMRNVELQTLWTRFNIYLIMNGGFLLAYVSSESGKFLNRHETISATFGFVFALLWLASELAGRHNLRHFDKKLGNLKAHYGVPHILTISI